MNREAWLEAATDELRTLMGGLADIEVPKVRVAAGWPSRGGTSMKRRTLGECWKPEVAADGVSQIFLNPMLSDPVEVLGVLVHELIHAWDKGEHGHKGPFVQVAKAVGLTGKWTATVVGEDLKPLLEEVSERLGEYPHSPLNPTLVEKKTQTTRMIKLVCTGCKYTVRTTQKWIDVGMPSCPEGDEMEVEVK